jgi:hypothetical protein
MAGTPSAQGHRAPGSYEQLAQDREAVDRLAARRIGNGYACAVSAQPRPATPARVRSRLTSTTAG